MVKGRSAFAAVIGTLMAIGVGAPLAQAAPAACNNNWIGPTTGTQSWNTGSNWSAGVPIISSSTPNTSVCILAAGTYKVTVPGNAAIASLQLGAGAGKGTQTLDLAGPSYIYGGETQNATTLQITGDSVINTGGQLTVEATNSGSTAGSSDKPGTYAQVYSAGTLTNNGTIQTVVDPGSVWGTLLGGTIVNNGTVNVSSGTLTAPAGLEGGLGSEPGYTFTNSGSGTWNVASGASMLLTIGGGAPNSGFTNSGTIANSGNVTMQNGGDTWTQSGGAITGNPIHLQSGTVLQDSAGTGSFTCDYSDCGLLGTIPSGQTVTLAGNSWVTGSNETSNDESFDLGGKTLINDGTLTIDAASGGSKAGPTDAAGANGDVYDGSITNNGTLNATVTNTSWHDDFEVSLTNAAGATFNVSGGKVILQNGQTVNNAGTINITPTGVLQEFSNPFTAGPETFNETGTIAPQIASATSFGTFALGGDSTFNAGGTVTPTLVGGFTPTAGEEFAVFPLSGATLKGSFGSVGGGFSADYSQETASTAFIGVIYGSPAATVGKVAVGKLRGGAGKGMLTVSCPTGAASCPSFQATGTVTEHLRKGKVRAVTAKVGTSKKGLKVITVATASGTLKPGASVTYTLTLNATGAALLKRFKRLSVRVKVTSGGSVINSATITITRAPAKHKRK